MNCMFKIDKNRLEDIRDTDYKIYCMRKRVLYATIFY